MRAIARQLKRSVSTISDELKRNKVKGRYDAKKAQHKTYVRRQNAKYQGKKIVEQPRLQAFVEELLYDDQSPPAIAGRLKQHHQKLPSVSKESIYRYIKSPYGRRLEYYREKKRTKRRGRRPRRGIFDGRTFIDERPQSINDRKRVGHAEGDFIVSGKSGHGILLVIVDRKLRVVALEQILKPTLQTVTRACQRVKKRYPEWKSMTTDNDLLFQHHKTLEKKLGITIFFCHPYSSWEKGSVENANKRIRRDIPKGSDLSRYSKRFVRLLEEKLNRRFLKCLHYATPAEVLAAYRKQKRRRSARKK